ncbi:hypothetical protein KI387_023346, partial [Taxus chinensis]
MYGRPCPVAVYGIDPPKSLFYRALLEDCMRKARVLVGITPGLCCSDRVALSWRFMHNFVEAQISVILDNHTVSRLEHEYFLPIDLISSDEKILK